MAYFGTKAALAESILDAPKPGMDPDVWTKNAEGEYVPTTYASQKIDAVVAWAAGFGLSSATVHVTGSIASNSYGDSSDVDLHFCQDGFEPEGGTDEFNKAFREAFAAEFGDDPNRGRIGVHPIEVYFQENPFQDMMSVGCYDYTERKWECGPELKDTAFDPYSEYYEKDMEYVDSLVSDVRDSVLGVYEKALVLKKTTDAAFAKRLSGEMLSSMKEAARLFDAMRNKRKVMSAPRSKADALKKRKSRKWHIADSAFKLFDRFGYMAVLRKYKELSEVDVPAGEAADAVIAAVQDAVTNNKMITDGERPAFGDGSGAQVDEGFGSALRNMALAGMMLAPGAAVAAKRPAVPGHKAAVVQRAVPKRSTAKRAAKAPAPPKATGRLSDANMKNLLSTIAYNETMLDWLKYRDDDEIIAVLNTVDNRAAGVKTNYPAVIREKSQYFSAKHVKGGYDDAAYRTYDPNDEAKAAGGALSRSQKECWRKCQEYARQMLDGRLKNVIGDRNMIGNSKIDTDRTAVGPDGWGAKCDMKIGGQSFGYQRNWDGYVRYGKAKPAGLTHTAASNAYVVKKGDTLWGIAKANGTTVDRLRTNNGLKSDAIRPGQTLKV